MNTQLAFDKAPRRAQRGVTMLFGLIALAIMMIGAAAMVRSMNSSMFTAGNLGFKRDLTNQAERATATAMAAVSTGALAAEAARYAADASQNYSATLLPANAQGIPNALLTDGAFAGVGVAGNDISVADLGVTVRYVIDRMCAQTGVGDPSHCTMSDSTFTNSGAPGNELRAEDNSAGGAGALPRQVVYRLSVRVGGPRDTQAYFQTTFIR
jgi:type IV pilus assembly protein PilX